MSIESTYVIKREREGGMRLLPMSSHRAQPLPAAANPKPLLLLHTLHPPMEGAAKAAEGWVYFFPLFPTGLRKYPKQAG